MAAHRKQASLDGFIKGKGPMTAAAADPSPSTSSGGKKRPRTDGTDVPPEAKKPRAYGTYAAFPANPPEPNEVREGGHKSVLAKLESVMAAQSKLKHSQGGTVVYWQRMKDIRVKDNMALSLASETAAKLNKTLIILHVLSPGDFRAHDRAPCRIDFVLRNLRILQQELDVYNIPLAIRTMTPRTGIPEKILDLCKSWNASHIFANLEYEVDELRRDVRVLELIKQRKDQIEVVLSHDYVLVPPGKISTKQDKPYSVFSPFHRAWSPLISGNLAAYSKDYPPPQANPDRVRTDPMYSSLFTEQVPQSVEGFEMPTEGQYTDEVHRLFPAGPEAAEEMLHRFMTTKSREGQFAESPLADGAVEDSKSSRAFLYSNSRNMPNIDGTSRLSPYLAAGVISIRACLRAILAHTPNGNLPVSRDTGLGSWTQELCFRDFYQHVMASWPRVSMGRNFVLALEAVEWDDDPNSEKLNAWIQGKTGYPFIDAGMRQMATQGWMHNRARMAVASFLVKDLMINWKEGERIFSRLLIDGDLGANNGGWQWCASTGTDPQPYFRIFNPINQSEKFDPTGDYIRYFVPELRNVKGKAIHEPFKHLKISEFKATGYPKPIVDHAAARKKAIARFKNPGTAADE